MSGLARSVSLVLLAFVALPDDAQAYIDPGTGSFVIQALVAAAAGVAVTLKIYWNRIKGLFGLSTKTEEEDDLSDGSA